ncbi:Protein of unknown function [Leuconostoc citreum LBAE E16]|nr:Protein of unknown function [Leuconostoc citreum LBAE E16]
MRLPFTSSCRISSEKIGE